MLIFVKYFLYLFTGNYMKFFFFIHKTIKKHLIFLQTDAFSLILCSRFWHQQSPEF